jgi:hypothetical protein
MVDNATGGPAQTSPWKAGPTPPRLRRGAARAVYPSLRGPVPQSRLVRYLSSPGRKHIVAAARSGRNLGSLPGAFRADTRPTHVRGFYVCRGPKNPGNVSLTIQVMPAPQGLPFSISHVCEGRNGFYLNYCRSGESLSV